jgi:Raf kinase inhibitor-like YbhB/YbcL family protein
MKYLTVYLVTALLLTACGTTPTPVTPPHVYPITATPSAVVEPAVTPSSVTLTLTSDAFGHEQPIPSKYACGGENVSPALSWNDPPEGTQSFALIMDDPDAGSVPFVHWVIFNIPASARGLPEAVPTDDTLPDGSINGRTSNYSSGYMGPCPPSDVHNYVFRLYALDTLLDLEPRISKG